MAMDTQSLLARPTLSVSPYHPAISASIGGLSSSPPHAQDSTRRLNGWSSYPSNVNEAAAAAAAVSHSAAAHGGSTCNPYGSAITAPTVPGPKVPYTSYSPSVTDLFSGTNCQQVPLNHLNSLSSRNFPFYSDMYNPNPTGMPGGSIFSDLAGMPSLPRFDTEAMGYPGALTADQSGG